MTQQASLHIYGIEADCDYVGVVSRAVSQLRGVTGVEFDQARHTMLVDFEPTSITIDHVVHAIERFGYRVSRRSRGHAAA